MKRLISNWYLYIVIGFLAFATLVFVLCGENSIIAVHDNLDLFIPQFQMMKNTGTFWSHGDKIPFLAGISRDCLPAEFSFYTMLYMILPSYWAYVVGYLFKILIALFSCILLAKELYGHKYLSYKPLVYMMGLAYGILNLFPAFGISFASIPLLIWLTVKIYRQPCWKWYLGLLFYPMLSYFSYFGLFLLAYMVVAFLWLWIKDKKFPGRILLAIATLSVGYIACEYRLFGLMLLGEEETIRSTMVAGSMSPEEIVGVIGEVFVKGMFHAESVHTYLVLPVCTIYFFYLNASYIRQKNIRGIVKDVFNLLALILVFNSVIYGIYYFEGFRKLVEAVCPPLTGWQFNRTIFFNPFVWYASFFLVLKRLYDSEQNRLRLAANLLAVLSVLFILFADTNFNDLYHTCYSRVYELVKGKPTDTLSYEEFYSTELFEEAKADIQYCGQWSAAYGFYPATLEYNNISTIDGYLGFYPQAYKEKFRKVIAPALERREESRIYYDEWGARAYLYSGTETSIVNAKRGNSMPEDIYIDLDAFKTLGGRFLFSRVQLTNAEEVGLILVGTYTNEKSPYTLYVYQTASRYQSRNREAVPYAEIRNLEYDSSIIYDTMTRLEALAEKAEENPEQLEEDALLSLWSILKEEFAKLCTCYEVAIIDKYQDVYSEEKQEREQRLLEEKITVYDEIMKVLRHICSSPYKESMKTVMEPEQVETAAEYKELTERQKEILLEENTLIQEYLQNDLDEYSFQYKDEVWNEEKLWQEADTLERADYIAIYQGIGKARNDVQGEIFLQLVALRNELAKLFGYDNYAEYAYAEKYDRDYTLEDAKELFEEIKRESVPIIVELIDEYYKQDWTALEQISADSGIECLRQIQPYMAQIDPELAVSFSHMLECEVYDISTSEYVANIALTQPLSYYQDAFILTKLRRDYYDYCRLIHEFGHYNNSYYCVEDIMNEPNCMDLMEIQSQGLEMLFYNYYDDILGEEGGKQCAYDQVFRLAEAAADYAVISEFELKVYENPNMTVTDMNELYLNLLSRYGSHYEDEITQWYNWCEIEHIFSVPCYYISYLTSGLSSLDILAMSMEDPHKAIETYMEITTLPGSRPYCDAVEYAGLRDIFEEGTVKEILQETQKLLQAQ